jgi:hypothetical protein
MNKITLKIHPKIQNEVNLRYLVFYLRILSIAILPKIPESTQMQLKMEVSVAEKPKGYIS